MTAPAKVSITLHPDHEDTFVVQPELQGPGFAPVHLVDIDALGYIVKAVLEGRDVVAEATAEVESMVAEGLVDEADVVIQPDGGKSILNYDEPSATLPVRETESAAEAEQVFIYSDGSGAVDVGTVAEEASDA